MIANSPGENQFHFQTAFGSSLSGQPDHDRDETMGKTNPTYRQLLDEWLDDWQHFERGLRHHQKEAFADVLDGAKAHADAAGYANPTASEVTEYALMSILVEQQQQLNDLQDEVADLQQRLGNPTNEA